MAVDSSAEELPEQRILAQFETEAGEATGDPFDIPLGISRDKLQMVCNAFLEKESANPYLFFVEGEEIKSSLEETIKEKKIPIKLETVVKIVYAPQALFKVCKPIRRVNRELKLIPVPTFIIRVRSQNKV